MAPTSTELLEAAGVLGQTSYDVFRRFHSEKKAPLVIILGSGLSMPAGLPNWEGLSKALENECEKTVSAYNKIGDELYSFRSRFETARKASDPWIRFKLYKELLGSANFTTVVRQALTPTRGTELPRSYRLILGLNPRGVVSLNLDNLASQALTELRPNDVQTPIYGKEIVKRLDLLQSADPYLVYLHGHINDAPSWILDYDDLQSLQKDPSHSMFLQYLYSFCRVLFYGISADDVALSGKLIEWREEGFRPPSLFWLTNRTDDRLLGWANDNYIRVIVYKANPSHEAVLDAIVKDCNGFSVREELLPPATRQKLFSSRLDLSPSEAAALAPDDIRKFLNDKISSLLSSSPTDEHYKIFEEFLKEYSRAVHNSYYLSETEPDVAWFDAPLSFPALGEGTFGQVYLSEDKTGLSAVKILREAIHNKTDMLGAFRRGVKSMQIIAKSKISGMIGFKSAYEVPPTIVMDFIDGVSLEGAVRTGPPMGWLTKLRILKQVASIVRKAHLLPETVLHRDLKPSNIMLQHYAYERDFEPDIVVLDFDMSWHKDSLEKDVLFEARDDFAYLAPEQINPNKLSLSRSTLVDSYGIGMTAFYIFGHNHPQINAYLDVKWSGIIYQAVRRSYEEKWISAPKRLSRLIETCTDDLQSRRLDFGQIIAEITSIEAAIIDPSNIDDARLFSEELIAHLVGADRYLSDRQGLRFYLQGSSGVTVESVCDDRRSTIELTISWIDNGMVERKIADACILGGTSRILSKRLRRS